MFQSSAALSSGCNTASVSVSSPTPRCFNPQPPFRAAATSIGWREYHLKRVSILSRPFERLQPKRDALARACVLFQSSAALSSGCNISCAPAARLSASFQSSAALSSGCNPSVALDRRSASLSFNPQPPFRAAATLMRHLFAYFAGVSILSRPFERLQRRSLAQLCTLLNVSILSRPFERLQQSLMVAVPTSGWFQSSAALSSGCNAGSITPVRHMLLSALCANAAAVQA